MSLDYNLKDIRSFEDLCYDKKGMAPLTECLVFSTMSIGMNRITKENYKEFFIRLSALYSVSGFPLRRFNEETQKLEKFAPSLYDVRDHIGLKTNASRKSMSAFMNGLIKHVEE